ncbi:MAG: hypothetical protein ABGY11_15110 [Candidatus Thioglobus sp.]|jgi:hypothetical protein
MTIYKEINNSVWDSFGKSLLLKKGSEKQVDFLQSCRDGKDAFLQYLNKNIFSEKDAMTGGKGVFFDHKFTESEFRFPPIDTQQIIWDTFQGVPRQSMGSCGFWGSVVIDMIKHDCITPDYLASNVNGVNETGIYMLDNAINLDDSKKTDDLVRRILRSMGNSAPRGKRIIFNDFYLGRAYWRWNWSNKMSNEISLSFEEILNTLDEKGYVKVSEKMHSQKSYVSQTNTFGGLLLFLNKNPSELVKNIEKIIDNISYLSIWKAIEIQSPELNQVEIENIASSL